MELTMDRINSKIFFITCFIIFSSLSSKCLLAQETEALKPEGLIANIGPYEHSSFAPSRAEIFLIPVTLNAPEQIKQLQLEIRSSDDDLIRALKLKELINDQNQYQIIWDGKDSSGQIVPDEAYHPVLVVTLTSNQIQRIDSLANSGGEEVYDFEKNIRPGSIEYTLPVNSRVLIRSGIKNGPMLRTIIDWEPRTAGFHAERWNGRDQNNNIIIEQEPQIGYLIVGYQLPNHSIITYGNKNENYRYYREQKKWPTKQASYQNRLLERNGKVVRPEFYNPILKQKSPRIQVKLLAKKSRKEIQSITGFNELITEVKLNPLDEAYLDQERYEISFFIDNEFIAEEEQGFVPFTWRWSPGRLGLKPGQHVLTVNVSGYNGQVGVKNIIFTLNKLPDQ